MPAQSDTPSEGHSNLGESAYEFIDTDEESRDDNATESVASTDYSRPDDVASLADTDQSEENESDAEGHALSAIPSFSGLEDAAETPTAGSSAATNEIDRSLTHSIEFEEPLDLDDEAVSVKHTIREFNEANTAGLDREMTRLYAQRRLTATIRQTMTKEGLSTREPLRILYIGSHSAKQDIIHKIASSVTASVGSGSRSSFIRHSPSQMYNVVPVSAFGSEKTPEIELMHSSGIQIKVEDCVFATNLKYEDDSKKPDVVKITLDGNFSHHSLPEGAGFTVEPDWELPHIAIFYCSDNDDMQTRRTRTFARTFMSRHNVPSIIVSHKQQFDRSMASMVLDQHAVHICLESRDPHSPRNVIHQRYPIDLASFLTIDARQMNRNLAYLTGLHDVDSTSITKSKTNMFKSSSGPSDIEKLFVGSNSPNLATRMAAEWRALLPFGMLLLSVFAATLTGYVKLRSRPVAGISINGDLSMTIPLQTESVVAAVTSLTTSVSSSTASSLQKSTKTVTVTQSKPSAPNSLAVLPFMDIAKLSETVQGLASTSTPNTSTVCDVEKSGSNEILIRIPSATKLTWLAREAIFVNVTRGNVSVAVERTYSSDDGVLLQIPHKEAYGLFNVSIVTTRKPKVNETFQVDFGINWTSQLHETYEWMFGLYTDPFLNGDEEWAQAAATTWAHAQALLEKTSDAARQQVDHVSRAASEQAAVLGPQLSELARTASASIREQSAMVSKEIYDLAMDAQQHFLAETPGVEAFREEMELRILKAQVKAKLFWLRVQGKVADYDRYEARAAKATREAAGYAHRKKQEARGKAWGRAAARQEKRRLRKQARCKKHGKKNC